MRKLTPYDTGARLEPKLWLSAEAKLSETTPAESFGKVDFENDESATLATVHIEQTKDGYRLVVETSLATDELEIKVL